MCASPPVRALVAKERILLDVPVRASPVPSVKKEFKEKNSLSQHTGSTQVRKKERKKTGNKGGMAVPSVVRGSLVVKFFWTRGRLKLFPDGMTATEPL